MTAKRGASNYLTDRNWDEEEEQEVAGEFVQATKETLQTRQIRKAKRRGNTTDETAGKSAFAGFSGFGAAKPATGAPCFSFGVQSKPLGTLAKNASQPALESTKVLPSVNGSSTVIVNNKQQQQQGQVPGHAVKKSEYLTKLRKLNMCIMEWIQQHVTRNPYCILTPVFADYDKHLTELDRKYPEDSGTGSEATPKPVQASGDASTAEPAKPASLFGTTTTSTTGFTFGTSSASKAPSTGFSFGSTNATSGFSFAKTGNSKPFSFTAAAKGAAAATQEQESKKEDDDEYVPPKVEVAKVEESDALYTNRCKLFYQKEGSWVEKGVGNLHVKTVDGGKTQLLIRADTNLGNILLNILLIGNMPIRRQGKNNVSLMCVPNPPLDPKAAPGDSTSEPTLLLIRVKTAKDADELFEKLNELKSEG